MFKIVNKKTLSRTLKEFDILAPDVARNAQAGQFVVVRINELGERIPLTIVSTDKTKGTVKIILQEVGMTTQLLGGLEVGDSIEDFLGPLGQASAIKNYGTAVCVGGGVGVAAIYPIAKALKESGNKLVSILGARSADLLILEEDMKKISDEYFVTTNDGSKGIKGFVTDILQDILTKQNVNIVFAVGPMPMMEAVFSCVRKFANKDKIPVKLSLETLMLDGIGMCGACRVSYFGETKFTCADGPEFDADGLDFQDIKNRQKAYKNQELQVSPHQGDCKCKK